MACFRWLSYRGVMDSCFCMVALCHFLFISYIDSFYLFKAFNRVPVIDQAKVCVDTEDGHGQVRVVLIGSFTSQIEKGPTLTCFSDPQGIYSPYC